MTKKSKIWIGLVGVVITVIAAICIIMPFVTKKVETERYSLSLPCLYYSLDTDKNCYKEMFSENEIKVTCQTLTDIHLEGKDASNEDEYLAYLIAKDGKYILKDGEKTEEGGYPLWKYGYGILSRGKFTCALYIHQEKDTFWCIYFSALEEEFDKLRKDIPKVISSFKIKGCISITD